MARRPLSRSQAVERVRRRLEARGSPRLQMSLIVAVTGGAGFMASSSLLHSGVLTMWCRYLMAFGVAYLVFLLLLWLWLRSTAPEYGRLDDLGDAADPVPRGESRLGASGSDSSIIDGLLDGADIGDGCLLPFALIALAAGLIVSAIFVVQAAPVLFAELIVDGVLSASLYRRLRRLQEGFWMAPALRHTFVPFLLTALLVSLAGWELARHAPGAHTIGEALALMRGAAP